MKKDPRQYSSDTHTHTHIHTRVHIHNHVNTDHDARRYLQKQYYKKIGSVLFQNNNYLIITDSLVLKLYIN